MKNLCNLKNWDAGIFFKILGKLKIGVHKIEITEYLKKKMHVAVLSFLSNELLPVDSVNQNRVSLLLSLITGDLLSLTELNGYKNYFG